MGNTIDWLTKVHEEAFPNENPCCEIMLDVRDTAMQSQPYVIDDLVAALREAVDLFENDDACNDVGTEEWVWHQQAQMILEQYGPSKLSESYADKLAVAYEKHGDLTWFPPSPPAPKFEITMPNFEIEMTELIEPALEISIPDGWVSFNVTFDGSFNWSAGGIISEDVPEDTTPDGILFSKV